MVVTALWLLHVHAGECEGVSLFALNSNYVRDYSSTPYYLPVWSCEGS